MIDRFLHRIKKHWQNTGLILMYHRVDEASCDPWELVVQPENFETHLQFLKANANVISMDELATAVSIRSLKKNTLAITFDDGYLDNYTNAAPLLEKYQLPATFYITTGGIGTNDQFWWDELQDLILVTETLPQQFQVSINNEAFNFDLGNECVLNQALKAQIKTWKAEHAPVNKRTELYFSVWKTLQKCDSANRKNNLNKIRQWTGSQSAASVKMMNWQQVISLSNNKLFSIGAHTVNHPALGAHPINVQKKEIIEGRDMLNKMLTKNIAGFAYPHGNYNSETISILLDAKFHYAVTTEANKVSSDSKTFELPRFQVKNWNKNTFNENFQQWQSGKA